MKTFVCNLRSGSDAWSVSPGRACSGTVATLYTFPQTDGLALNATAFQESRRSGRAQPIDGGTILTVNSNANPRMKPRFVHWILRFLLEAPEFEISSYRHRDSEILKAPPAVNQLEWRELFKTTRYMLSTAHIDNRWRGVEVPRVWEHG